GYLAVAAAHLDDLGRIDGAADLAGDRLDLLLVGGAAQRAVEPRRCLRCEPGSRVAQLVADAAARIVEDTARALRFLLLLALLLDHGQARFDELRILERLAELARTDARHQFADAAQELRARVALQAAA